MDAMEYSRADGTDIPTAPMHVGAEGGSGDSTAVRFVKYDGNIRSCNCNPRLVASVRQPVQSGVGEECALAVQPTTGATIYVNTVVFRESHAKTRLAVHEHQIDSKVEFCT